MTYRIGSVVYSFGKEATVNGATAGGAAQVVYHHDGCVEYVYPSSLKPAHVLVVPASEHMNTALYVLHGRMIETENALMVQDQPKELRDAMRVLIEAIEKMRRTEEP